MTEVTGIGWRGWLTRVLLLVLLASLIGAVLLYTRYQRFLEETITVPADGLLYEFRSGASLSRLARDLAAEIMGISAADAGHVTGENARRLFAVSGKEG